jgi:mutual gliding-motility protein MglA
MAVFNYQKKEIDAKIVYYGPGISGKTTNLQYIHQHLKPEQRGKMVSLATDEERTLFFDFLPIELESVRGFRTRFHLYTVPGQVYYGATRRAVLTGADGIIFVADSQRDRMEDNLISIKDLEENLHYYGRKAETMPLILQYNKRDLPNVLPVDELNSKINRLNVPYFESVAILGKGVFETLTMMCRMVLKTLEDGIENRKSSPGPSPVTPEAPFKKPAAERRPSPGEPASKPTQPSPLRSLRLEKSEAPVAAAPPEPAPRPAKQVFPEKTLPHLEPAGVGAGLAVKRAINEPHRSELPRAPRVGQILSPRIEEDDRKKGNGRGFLSRMFEKKKAEPLIDVEGSAPIKPEEPKEKMRIASCGQPRLTTSGTLEIPIILEVSTNGQGKNLAVNLQVAIQLDALQVQE